MTTDIDKTLKILELQLSQAIVWYESIQAIASARREDASIYEDRFIFASVYDALWDAVIIKTCAMWDDNGGTVALKVIAKDFSRSNNVQALNLAKKIDAYSADRCSHLATIKMWRNKTVAHRADIIIDSRNGMALTEEQFDKEFPLQIATLKSELEYIETILIEARKIQKQAPAYFQCLKEDVADEAHEFLKLWKLGAETENKSALDTFVREALKFQ